jgi:excisionase family DNA binding protein
MSDATISRVEPRPLAAAMTKQEAAAYLSMSVSWLEHSDVPRVKLGTRVRFLRDDLDAYLAQRRDRDAA